MASLDGTIMLLDLKTYHSTNFLLPSPMGHTSGPINVLHFHLTRRSNLMILTARSLVIYDIAEPGAPIKTVPFPSESDPAVYMSSTTGEDDITVIAAASGQLLLLDSNQSKP